jgi:hypothetical protein
MRKRTKSKKGDLGRSGAEKPAGSPENHPTLEAYTSEAFDRLVAKAGYDQASIDATIKEVAGSFGNPHLHQGLGLRDLGGSKGLYECRWAGNERGGLELRLVFKKLGGRPKTLLFDFIGDHNAVRKYLKR